MRIFTVLVICFLVSAGAAFAHGGGSCGDCSRSEARCSDGCRDGGHGRAHGCCSTHSPACGDGHGHRHAHVHHARHHHCHHPEFLPAGTAGFPANAQDDQEFCFEGHDWEFDEDDNRWERD